MKGVSDIVQGFEQVFQVGDQNDAVSLLKKDHAKVKKLFSQWESARGSTRKQQLLNEIVKELMVHETVEEDLIYPILEDNDRKKIKEKTAEGLEEQHLMKLQLAELSEISADSPMVKAKMSVLKEAVLRHAKEEESVLFPALKTSGVNLDVVGQQLLKRKQQLLSDVARGGGAGKKKNRNASLTSIKGRVATSGKSGTCTHEEESCQHDQMVGKTTSINKKRAKTRASRSSRTGKSASTAKSRRSRSTAGKRSKTTGSHGRMRKSA